MTNVSVTQLVNRVTVVAGDEITVKISVPGVAGPPGPGVPIGGETGQLLVKNSATDYDTEWTSDPVVDSLTFDTSVAPGGVADGQAKWNSDEGTVELGKGGISNYLGQEVMVMCRNASNTTEIPKGTAVMFAGTLGASGRLKVSPMVANGTYPGYVFFGVADQAIAPSSDGYVTTFGKIRGVDTSIYADGDILWCDPSSPGGFTKTEPSAPNLKLAVAAVIRATNNGTIFVRWETGSRLQDLHDVESGGSKSNDDRLVWNASSLRWEPKTTVYVFTQSAAASQWTINHNLGFKPSVELFNSGSQEIDGDVVHTSTNQTVVYFTASLAGFARLN